jgi:hypothetical protein
MNKQMTWKEMKTKYPDEWLVIIDFKLDKFGEVTRGVVAQHSQKPSGINENPVIDRDTEIRFTGEFSFNGLKSHAAHDNSL